MSNPKDTFTVFYQQISKPFWRFIFSMCRDEGLTDEIFQESFIRFLRKAPRGLNDFQKKAYLYRTGARLLIDNQRRIKQEQIKRHELRSDNRSESNSIISLDMENIFPTLKPKEQKLLWLAYVEGYDHREIGRILGAGEKSIKVMLFRARNKLADLLVKKGYTI